MRGHRTSAVISALAVPCSVTLDALGHKPARARQRLRAIDQVGVVRAFFPGVIIAQAVNPIQHIQRPRRSKVVPDSAPAKLPSRGVTVGVTPPTPSLYKRQIAVARRKRPFRRWSARAPTNRSGASQFARRAPRFAFPRPCKSDHRVLLAAILPSFAWSSVLFNVDVDCVRGGSRSSPIPVSAFICVK
jgi:hypothetical protein